MEFPSLRIDAHNLEKEWIDHPQVAHDWNKYVAECSRKLDQAKAKLRYVEAEIDKCVREYPEHYKLKKTSRGYTETAIAGAVIMSHEYIEAEEALIEAQYNYNVARGVQRDLHDKKSALEHLVRLYGMDYYGAEPKGRAEDRAAAETAAVRRRSVTTRKKS